MVSCRAPLRPSPCVFWQQQEGSRIILKRALEEDPPPPHPPTVCRVCAALLCFSRARLQEHSAPGVRALEAWCAVRPAGSWCHTVSTPRVGLWRLEDSGERCPFGQDCGGLRHPYSEDAGSRFPVCLWPVWKGSLKLYCHGSRFLTVFGRSC